MTVYKGLLKDIETTIEEFKECQVDKDHPLNWMLDRWIKFLKDHPGEDKEE